MSMVTDSVRAKKDAVDALADDSLRAGQAINLTLTTPSMLPTLQPGDQVIVRGARADELRLGDIVLIQAGAARIAHRLIGWRRVDDVACLVTKGDHAPVADAICLPTDLCGIIIAAQRGERRLNFQSAGARGVNRLLAFFSRGEDVIFRAPPSLLRRIVLKGVRVFLRAGVLLLDRLV